MVLKWTATERRVAIFMAAVMTAALAVSLYGISQQFLGERLLIDGLTYNSGSDLARTYLQAGGPFTRVLSSYGDPNVLAGQLVIFCAVSLALAMTGGLGAAGRLLCAALFLLNAVCLYYTGSRAGIAGLLLASLCILFWCSRISWFLLPLAIFCVVMTAGELLFELLPQRFHQFDLAGDGRASFPQLGWQIIKSIPAGCGFGNTVACNMDASFATVTVVPGSSVWAGLNSFWLNKLSRVGLVGVGVFAIFLGCLWRYIWLQSRAVCEPRVRAFVTGALAGLLAQALIWWVNNTYILPGGGLNFWFLTGGLVACCKVHATPASQRVKEPSALSRQPSA